jgi:PadR family transcriptional regulator, regulatory protein PadR
VRISSQTITVLHALQKGTPAWTHGYELSRITGLKSGTLYPILVRLHDEGWLEAKWEPSHEQSRPPRHLYRITAAGSSESKKIFQLADAKRRTQRLAYER